MEEKTFFGRLIASIVSVFKSKFKVWIAKRWNEVVDELKHELVDLIKIVDQIKDYADSPFLDAVVKLTPTQLDDDGLRWLRSVLVKIGTELRLIDLKVSDLTGTDYGNISAKLIEAHTGMPEGQAKITAEITYQNT